MFLPNVTEDRLQIVGKHMTEIVILPHLGQLQCPGGKIVLSVLLAAALIALGGGALVAAALLVLWRYHHVAVKEFGGITGDLAGWFLQKAEFWMLAALAASQWGGIL